MNDITKQIQNKIFRFSVIAVALSFITSAVLCIYPFYTSQRQIEKRDLMFARDTTVLLVDGYMSRIKEVSKQIASRTKARMLLEQLLSHNNNEQENKRFLRKILNGALSSNKQLLGITRITALGEVVATVGKPINETLKPNIFNQTTSQILGPITLGDRQFISVVMPIFSADNTLIGSDICLFDITTLQSTVHSKIQSRLGDIIIAYVDKNKTHIFSPIDSPWKNVISQDRAVMDKMTNGLRNAHAGTLETQLKGDELFLSYAPLYVLPQWGVGVIVKKGVLFSSLTKTLSYVLIAVLIFLLIAIGILTILLKPLSGRILINNKELKKEIELAHTELKVINGKLEQLALYDSLTGALNRRGFVDLFDKEVNRAKRSKVPFAIFYIDINDFKLLNDTYGHKVGDWVLKDLVTHLNAITRSEDHIGRLGGDEFIILSTNINDETCLNMLAKLNEASFIPRKINGKEVKSTISIGSAIYELDNDNFELMLERADKKMYAAKRNSKNQS